MADYPQLESPIELAQGAPGAVVTVIVSSVAVMGTIVRTVVTAGPGSGWDEIACPMAIPITNASTNASARSSGRSSLVRRRRGRRRAGDSPAVTGGSRALPAQRGEMRRPPPCSQSATSPALRTALR